MHRLVVWLLLVVLSLPAQANAAISCDAAFPVTSGTTASETVTITVPAETNRRSVIAVLDRSESATITGGVPTDDGGGTWVERGAQYDSTSTTARTWLFERSGGGTGSTIITVAFSGIINSVLVAGTCWSDTASLDFVSAATPSEHTPATVDWVGPSRTFTNTGIIFGYTGQNGNATLTPVGSEVVKNTSTLRSHIVTLAGSSGASNQAVTLNATAVGSYGAVLYQEAASASTNFFPRRREQ